MLALALVLSASSRLTAQTPRPLVDVESYNISVEVDLPQQSLEAITEVRFIPREETKTVVFELHNGLNVMKVVTEEGTDIPVARYRQDYTVHLNFPDNLPVGQPVNLTFLYGGRLAGTEDSPVEGVSLASINPERAFLLYPGRWFPVNGYGADRFSANINVTVRPEFKVVASGLSAREALDGKVMYKFQFGQASFPGSVAIVPEEATRVESEGIATEFYFRSASAELKQAYADSIAEMMRFFSEKFGSPYATTLALVETGDRAPNAYSAPGIVFMSPYGIGDDVNRRLLGAEVAHQWWRVLVSPGNRNHTWLDLGLAKYSSVLEIKESAGEDEFLARLQDIRIEALTYDEIPMLQSGRLPDFSSELNALAGAKGAMVLHMLHWSIGDEPFFATLKQFLEKFAWQSATTDDFREVAEAVSGKNLQPFFIQWTENKGTPEFSQEYTIYRVGGGKGFRVMGKVKQDLDTFSMPIELKIETEGEPEYEVVEVTGLSSDYVVETFGKPKKVILDPNNHILRYDPNIHVLVAIRKGEQLVELGYYNDALTEYQKALDINRYSSLAHYRIAEVFFLQNNYQSAANEFREALNGDREPPWIEVWSHINLGKIFDITGQRERAVNEYQLAIRTRDNTQGAQDEARKHLEQPYRRPRRTERIY